MLQISNLYKHYGKQVALNGFDLHVAKGQTVVVMGPSGCGKSTAIRCINRLTEPDKGEILINNRSVLQLGHEDLLRFRRNVGFVFQQFHLIARLSVLDNVAFHLVLGGIPRDEAYERAKNALGQVGLAAQGSKQPSQLSGGEQQRVGIARALVSNPELMLWDEPTASLDPILVGEVLDVMEGLVRTTRTTMVIVTHEVSFALNVADRIVLMDQGRVVEEGPPMDVFEAPQSNVGQKYQRLIAG